MIPYSLRQQGWMHVDHAGGAITRDQARRIGLPGFFADDGVHEVDTLHCKHCGCVVIKNPDRTRARGHCTKCDWFVCDVCAVEMQHPDYVHSTWLSRAEEAKRAAANLKVI